MLDPQGPFAVSSRLIRGGNWLDDARYCRSADRYDFYDLEYGDGSHGFRVVLAPGQP